MPSQLESFYWSVSLSDMKHKVNQRFSLETAKSAQAFTSLVEVAKMIVGTSDKDDVKSPSSFEDAAAQFSSLFG